MKDGPAEGGPWFGGQHFRGGRRPALCSSSLVPCSAPAPHPSLQEHSRHPGPSLSHSGR